MKEIIATIIIALGIVFGGATLFVFLCFWVIWLSDRLLGG